MEDARITESVPLATGPGRDTGPPPTRLKVVAVIALLYSAVTIVFLIWLTAKVGIDAIPGYGIALDGVPKLILFLASISLLTGSRFASNVFSIVLVFLMAKPFLLLAMTAFGWAPDWFMEVRGKILITSFVHAGIAFVLSLTVSTSKSIEAYFR